MAEPGDVNAPSGPPPSRPCEDIDEYISDLVEGKIDSDDGDYDGSEPAADEGSSWNVVDFDEARAQSRSRRAHQPFQFKFFGDIDPAPRKHWLVRHMLGAGDLSIVYGEPGCGKSVLATDLAFHVAAGLEWNGRAVGAGAVLYVAAERSKLTERRFAALRKRFGYAEARLAILAGRFDFFSSNDHAMRLAATAEFMATSTGEKVVLIIIDTVARVIPGADENHSRDIGRFIENMDTLRRETGAHVLAIHHAGKDKTKGMRGSTALLGAADTTICVEKGAGEDNPLRTAKVDKSNDEGEGESISFKLESIDLFTDEETGEKTTAPIVVQSESAVNNKPKRTQSSLSAGDKAVFDCLHRAIDDYGVTTPAGPDFPPGVTRVVDEKYWRELAYKHTGTADTNKDAKRTQFNRGVTNLISRHLVSRNGEWVWPTK
jgi:hypothetical protein